MHYAQFVRLEPAFDPPPWFGGSNDRRLASRAAALWTAACGNGDAPDAAIFTAALVAIPNIVANTIWLDCSTRGTAARAVGPAIAAAFNIRLGLLAGGGPLAAELDAACRGVASTAMPASFEAGFACRDGEAVTLLARGVVLPLGGGAGCGVVAAVAVMAWKELLSPSASGRLYREISAMLRPQQTTATVLPFPAPRR